MKKQGNLYIIAGPSGSGKTTLFKMALERFSGLNPSVSYTTRPMREGEKEGIDYFFVSNEKFDAMIKQNKFIEWAKVHNYKYGTAQNFIEDYIKKGKDLLFDVDVKGAKNLKKLFPAAVLIFILPPSYKTLKNRLKKRMTNISADIDVRTQNALDEIKCVAEFNYLIINDDLDEAFENLKAVIVNYKLLKQKEIFDFDEFMNK